ncbi:MAG TPA: hypothetical protein EYQ74_05390 [Planctomycetes bacterium]|nr:hypothetical protein [Planctomycetota bacterium]HIK61436.1 hypothetical protein [Planctomycetota bacterium]
MAPAVRPHFLARHPWLIGPLLMAATAVGLGLVLKSPDGLAVWVLGGAGGLALVWILCTTLWPSRADRTCPECGAEGLRRMDPATTRGLMCTACGHTDAEASGWFLAEEEGALDEVIAKRHRSNS